MEEADFIQVYKEYWGVLKENQRDIDLCDYDWADLPEKIPFEWMIYHQYLSEHASELANSINELAVTTRKLSFWEILLERHTEEERIYIVSEFIDPLATICLNLPYAIRSRFIFSVCHLGHQANRAVDRNWQDNLPPDNSINFKIMRKVAQKWNQFPDFCTAFSALSDNSFIEQVHDFRNKYHHSYPPNIGFGHSGMVTRTVNDGKARYGVGFIRPLQLSELIPILEGQHMAAFKAFGKYKELVSEQISKIFHT